MEVVSFKVPEVPKTKNKLKKRQQKVEPNKANGTVDLKSLDNPTSFANDKKWLIEQAENIMENDCSLNPIDVFNKLTDYYYDQYVSEEEKRGPAEPTDDEYSVKITGSLNLIDSTEMESVNEEREQEEIVEKFPSVSSSLASSFYQPSPSDCFNLDVPLYDLYDDDQPIPNLPVSNENSPEETDSPFKIPALPVELKRKITDSEVSEANEYSNPITKRKRQITAELTSPVRDSDDTPKQLPKLFGAEVTVKQEEPLAKKGRGRPKGSKNRPKEDRPMKIEKVKQEPIEIKNKQPPKPKSAFTWANLLTLGLLNAPMEKAVVNTLYQFIQHHFPNNALKTEKNNETWKNTIRHNLSAKYGFTQDITGNKSAFWIMNPDRREELITDCIAKANEFKYDIDSLKMRYPEILQEMLNGEVGLPTTMDMYEYTGNTYKVKEDPKVDENNEEVKHRLWNTAESQGQASAMVDQQQFQQIPESMGWNQNEQQYNQMVHEQLYKIPQEINWPQVQPIIEQLPQTSQQLQQSPQAASWHNIEQQNKTNVTVGDQLQQILGNERPQQVFSPPLGQPQLQNSQTIDWLHLEPQDHIRKTYLQQASQPAPRHQTELQHQIHAPLGNQLSQIPGIEPQNGVPQTGQPQLQKNSEPVPWYKAVNPVTPRYIHYAPPTMNMSYNNPASPALQDQFANFSQNQPNQWNYANSQQEYRNLNRVPMSAGSSSQWPYQQAQFIQNSHPQEDRLGIAGATNQQNLYGNQSQPNYNMVNNEYYSEVETGDYGIHPQEPNMEEEASHNEQYIGNYRENNSTTPQPLVDQRPTSVNPNINDINNSV